MRLEIHLQREIARLHYYDEKSSNRAIADAVGVSPTTVGSFRELLRAKPIEWAALQALDDKSWRDTLETHDRSIVICKPAPEWAWVHQEMQRPDATIEQIWREWREQVPEGIGHTQFTTGYRKYTNKLHVVMRRVHRPGVNLFVDFAGRVVPIHDAQGRPAFFAQIFVAVLGYSNLTFIYAVPTQTTADWVQCHVRCFEYMGGTPEWVVSDNLKAAVWRRERDRVVINPTYRDCLMHYDTAAAPTRSRRPKDKAKAEVGVQIAQRWALFALRDRVFTDIAELNQELRILNNKLNDHALRKTGHGRECEYATTPGSCPSAIDRARPAAVLTHGKRFDLAEAHLYRPSTRWESIMGSNANAVYREPWNKGKIVGQKAPFKLKDIWALRVRLQMESRVTETLARVGEALLAEP